MSPDTLPPSLMKLMEGDDLFEGKYRLLRPLGKGSFASVIHARHEAMDREVALKVLRPDVLREHPDVGERFLTEVRLASRLTSPHTVTIFDFGRTDEGIPFMVLEYVDGRPLDYAMDKYGALGLRRSIRITLQILESLEEAHDHNIIHRDLKPANVMVGEGMKKEKEGVHVRVLDFGVAKLVDEASSELGDNTDERGRRSTQFIGTPHYMSPEQILGREVSPASDFYSLGLMFYEMATGDECNTDSNVAEAAQAHLSEDGIELEGIDELPPVLGRIIDKATARQREDRFQSAREFSKALNDALTRRQKNAGNGVESDLEMPKDADRSTSEVFTGAGYVEPPDESELEASKALRDVPRKRSSSTRSTPGSSPSNSSPRPPSSAGSRRPTPDRTDRPVGSGPDLDAAVEELDQQRLQMARQRRYGAEQRNRDAIERLERGEEIRRWVASILGLLASGVFGFVVVGGALESLGVALRTVASVSPLGLGLLWAVFTETAYPDAVRRTMIPWAKRTAAVAVAIVVVLGLVMPESAGNSLRDDALWFMAGWPEALQWGWLQAGVEGLCGGVAWVMERVALISPWSG